jgi:sulfide dehydrogenase [flavocytochrome c] flavoprotein chain
MNPGRRRFLSVAGLALAGLPFVARSAELLPKTGRRVVVIGGGFGGAIAAKHVRMEDPSIEVVLVERSNTYVACPFSNLVIGGSRDIQDNAITYDGLAARHGIQVLNEEVTAVDPGSKTVVTAAGTLRYDRLVVAPGIDFRYEEIEGSDPAATPRTMPHAWKAGEQTLLLRSQLEAMRNGGTVVIAIPLAPFRSPPGPYERACQIAWFLKARKPKSKIIVLDANPDIVAKGPLFRKAWKELYPGLVDYRPGSKVAKVNAATLTVDTGVESVKGEVINLIPPQKAGAIAHQAGLVGEDRKWCPVNQVSFESQRVPGIHVIGDACSAGAMPKSAFSANSQGKVAAINLVALMNGREPVAPAEINVCYSFVNEREAMAVSAVYRVLGDSTVAVPGAGGLSSEYSVLEGLHARSWMQNILEEMSS